MILNPLSIFVGVLAYESYVHATAVTVNIVLDPYSLAIVFDDVNQSNHHWKMKYR